MRYMLAVNGSYDWMWENLSDNEMVQFADKDFYSTARELLEHGVDLSTDNALEMDEEPPQIDIETELQQAFLQFQEAREAAAERLNLTRVTLSVGTGGAPGGARKAPFIHEKVKRLYTTTANGTAYRWEGTFYSSGSAPVDKSTLPEHWWGNTPWEGYVLPDGRKLFFAVSEGDAYRFDTGMVVVR